MLNLFTAGTAPVRSQEGGRQHQVGGKGRTAEVDDERVTAAHRREPQVVAARHPELSDLEDIVAPLATHLRDDAQRALRVLQVDEILRLNLARLVCPQQRSWGQTRPGSELRPSLHLQVPADP